MRVISSLQHPAIGIYLHMTAKADIGFRVIEVWDSAKGFQAFLAVRLANKGASGI